MKKQELAKQAWELMYTSHTAKDQILKQLNTDTDLTPQQLRLLLQIGQMNMSTQSEIAQELDIDLGNLSRLCKTLEEKELIKRTRSNRDLRVVHVELQDEGRSILQNIERKSLDLLMPFVQENTVQELETMVRGMTMYTGLIKDIKESFTVEPQ